MSSLPLETRGANDWRSQWRVEFPSFAFSVRNGSLDLPDADLRNLPCAARGGKISTLRPDCKLTENRVCLRRGIRDLKNHTSEMCELKRTLDNEMKLQEFLGVKGQFREMVDLNAKREAERQAKREEKQNRIAAFTQILQTIKQFTGTGHLLRIILRRSHFKVKYSAVFSRNT